MTRVSAPRAGHDTTVVDPPTPGPDRPELSQKTIGMGIEVLTPVASRKDNTMVHCTQPALLDTRCVARPASLEGFAAGGDGQLRARWRGRVIAHGPHGSIPLEGVELGRTTMRVRGPWRLYAGACVTLEFELQSERVFVVASVDTSRSIGGQSECLLRFSVTSPRGNDLLDRHVHTGMQRAPTIPRLQGAELETVIVLANRRRTPMCEPAAA